MESEIKFVSHYMFSNLYPIYEIRLQIDLKKMTWYDSIYLRTNTSFYVYLVI